MPSRANRWLPGVADVLDVLTYHHYSDSGTDDKLAEKVMTPEYLDGTRRRRGAAGRCPPFRDLLFRHRGRTL